MDDGQRTMPQLSLRRWLVNFLLPLLLLLTSGLIAYAQSRSTPARPVTKVGRYVLQSNRWVNLHQRLLYEARFKEGTPTTFTAADLAKWKKAVEMYRVFLGRRSPIVDDELKHMNATLAKTNAARLPEGIPAAAAEALKFAMPLYQASQWEQDDRINRFWISVAEPLLNSAGEELIEANEKAYGMPFPKHILVDVCQFAWEFGAYTVPDGEAAHVVISSTDPAGLGFRSLEAMMHEPSHVIVDASSGAIGGDLTRIGKELGLKPRYNLWHAILFYTAGETTRRALAARGVSDYQRVIDAGMYERGFQGFKQPLETHWQAFLDGRISREAALREILKATAATK